ncbi:MAG: multiple sugar transport system substrate-binding protein [Gammaproteobacteria bacterium]|jgi:multiple sugar transport system substrate-binding protein
MANESNSRFKLSSQHLDAAVEASRINSGRKTTLNLLLPQGSMTNILPLTKEFTRLSGINFEFTEVPVDDINTRLFLATRLSDPSFDIALPATFGIPDLAEAGAILPIDDLSTRYQPNNYYDDALYGIGDFYRGKHYGYQTDGDCYLMFYNRRFLDDEANRKSFEDKYGYELKVPQTWQQLDSMIKHLHNPSRGNYGGSLFRIPNYMLWEWWVRFHAKGFFPLDDDLTPQINNDAGVEALEEMIAVSDYLSPDVRSDGLFENWEAFSQGNSFCNIGWGGTQKYLFSDKSDIRNELANGPTPGGMINGKLVKTSYFNWGWNFTIYSQTQKRELAYLFILFSTSPVMSTLAVRQDGYFDPYRDEHYNDPVIQSIYSKEFLQQHKQGMTNSIPDLYLSGQTLYYNVLREHISMAFEGQLSPRAALDKAARSWKRLHFKQGKPRQQEQWRLLKEFYPADLATVLK